MKRILTPVVLSFIVLSAFLSSCDHDSPENHYISKIELASHQYDMTNNLLGFTIDIMGAVDAENPNGSWMFSPFGIAASMALLSNYADEEASKEILDELGLSAWSKDEINRYFETMLESISQYGFGNTTKFGSYLSLEGDMTLDSGNSDALKEAYGLSLSSYSKEDSEALLNSINGWSGEKISGELSKPVKTSDIDPDGGIVFSSGFSYEGKWRYKFPSSQTSKETFVRGDRSSTMVDMMKRPYVGFDLKVAGDYLGRPDMGMLKFSVWYPGLIIPYTSGAPLFENFQQMISYMKKYNPGITLLICSNDVKKIEYWLPKFETPSTALDMKKCLMDIGIEKIFSDGITLSGGDKTKIGSFPGVGYFRTNEDGFFEVKDLDSLASFNYTTNYILKNNRPFYYFVFLQDPFVFLLAGKYDGN